MVEQPIDPNTAPAPVALDSIKGMSGHDENEKLADGTVVKGDYDQSGKLVGWHKEVITEGAI
jgi:hypothetical protein